MMQKRFSIWSHYTTLIWVITTVLFLNLLSHGHAEIQNFTDCRPSKDRQLASDYVSAFTSRLEAGQSCETNVTSSDQRDVHVIVVNLPEHDDDDVDDGGDDNNRNLRRPGGRRFDQRGDQQKHRARQAAVVQLEVLYRHHSSMEDLPAANYQESSRPMIFVLLSSVRVKWKIEEIPPPSQGKHLFLISPHDSFRLRRRRFKRLVKCRDRDMPEWSDHQAIQRWTQRRFGGVTSFSEINATTVKFYTGRDVNANSECDVTALAPSTRILSSHKDSQPITGCVSMGERFPWKKSVYVLELLQRPKVPYVSLEIIPDESYSGQDQRASVTMRDGSTPGRANNPRFVLVIKSPEDLKWSVHSSKKMAAWMRVVTDGDINLDDLKFSTIGLLREELNRSGQDLVEWSREFYTDVQMYAAVQSANVVQLKIPPRVINGDRRAGAGDVRTHVGQSHQNQKEDDLNRPGDGQEAANGYDDMITTKCTSDHMEVAIAKTFIEASQVDKYKISLRDSSCRMSQETDNHIILRTGLNECGTHLLEMDNLRSYSNKVRLWTSPSLVHSLIQDLGSGNFEEGEMGSGSHDSSPFMDDEDFETKHLALDVDCKIFKEDHLDDSTSRSQVGGGGIHDNNAPTSCKMDLFTNSFFVRPEMKFPMTVTKDEFIYIMASVTNKDVTLLVDACWLSSSQLPQLKAPVWKPLISQGCESSSALRWYDDPMDAPIGTDLKTTKFGFQLSEEFLGKSHVYLHCQFRTCHRDNIDSADKCPIESSKRCKQVKERLPGELTSHVNVDCGPLTIGPIELTDKEVHVKRPGTQQRESVTQEDDDDKKQQQHHQRIIIEGLDSPTVVGIAFAAFIIGIILVGALWFIHSHTGPMKTAISSQANVNASGDLTPNSSSPMTA